MPYTNPVGRGAPLSEVAAELNRSIGVDSRMFRQDIAGSIAHATMLGATGIIAADESRQIVAGLELILADLESGALAIDMSAEDIHMFVEVELTRRIGAVGGKLHTARSRNDQVATDLRLYLKDHAERIALLVVDLRAAVSERAAEYDRIVMPGYTHLQRAQPIFFGRALGAYVSMLTRDLSRLYETVERMMSEMPLGSAALAGTTYPIDRDLTAKLLGFAAPCANTIDGVSDRDFAVELAADLAIIAMHLSRLSEELVIWSSHEFRFITLDDMFTTGSSIMPQKKNPDMAELVRGKTGRVYGDLLALLTALKGLPLAYNKDMQEDKEAIFDALDTVELCLAVYAPMIRTLRANPDAMRRAAEEGFIAATDLADYLAKKGMPFREAYALVGKGIVNDCQKNGKTLSDLTLAEYKAYSHLFESDLYDAIDLTNCAERRK